MTPGPPTEVEFQLARIRKSIDSIAIKADRSRDQFEQTRRLLADSFAELKAQQAELLGMILSLGKK